MNETGTTMHNAPKHCYYGDVDVCRGELWTCQSCGEMYCQAHWHRTDKGKNVECVACERARKEKESEA